MDKSRTRDIYIHTSPAVLSRFSISKLLPREDCLERDSPPCPGSAEDGAGELSISGE